MFIGHGMYTHMQFSHAGRIGKEVYSAEWVFLHLLDGDD
jgi:hypothetical protein